jgi:L-asparaginase
VNNGTSILIIYTGGTIGMIQDAKTGALHPLDFSELPTLMPDLKRFDYQLSTISFNPPIDSANVSPTFWCKLVEIIEENYDRYDGFVILHGTDTMAYTASALSFMLENLQKPIIFTGAQLPIGAIRTDGKENLVTSIEIAAEKRNDLPVVPEVCIYFENKLFRGNRASKYSAEHFSAFRAVNYPTLAEVGIHIKYNYSAIHYPATKDKLKVHKQLDTNIGLLKIFPGISKNIVDAVLNTKGLKALVLETFGSGNAMTDPWFLDKIKTAVKEGIIVLNVSQCFGGSVDMGKYKTSEELRNCGVISGYDTTTEAALTKLMFLLAQHCIPDEIIKALNKPLRGEITTS